MSIIAEHSDLTIQQVSRRTGLAESALRYYERIGLIGAVPRDQSSGHRRYPPDLVAAIEALSCLRGTGMSVHDMRAYVANMRRGDRGGGAAGALRPACGSAWGRDRPAEIARAIRGDQSRALGRKGTGRRRRGGGNQCDGARTRRPILQRRSGPTP